MRRHVVAREVASYMRSLDSSSSPRARGCSDVCRTPLGSRLGGNDGRTMLRCLAFLLVWSLTFSGSASANDTATVSLRNAADLPGTRYTLGDIADIDTADASLRQ